MLEYTIHNKQLHIYMEPNTITLETAVFNA